MNSTTACEYILQARAKSKT